MADALIALGGNLGEVRETLERALRLLCEDGTVCLIARSSDYRTPPWGIEEQPEFVNACAQVATTLPPRDLLARAHAVERALGRDRAQETRWGPRTIDIDLLAYDEVEIDEPGLQLPHPRVLERAFVLVPLKEIAPDWEIGGTRVRDALARLDLGGIERLPPR